MQRTGHMFLRQRRRDKPRTEAKSAPDGQGSCEGLKAVRFVLADLSNLLFVPCSSLRNVHVASQTRAGEQLAEFQQNVKIDLVRMIATTITPAAALARLMLQTCAVEATNHTWHWSTEQ